MPRSQRLEGLELLRSIGAPVPEWKVVDSVRELDNLGLRADVEWGWTIRTCRRDGQREVDLFYANYTDHLSVVRILRERLAAYGDREFYIVYPSWKFRFSCNIVLRDHVFWVEGKYGSQKDLAVGRATPDFGLRIPFGVRSETVCYIGQSDSEVDAWLGRILYWCKRISAESYYAEVALTQDPVLMFYELFSL